MTKIIEIPSIKKSKLTKSFKKLHTKSMRLVKNLNYDNISHDNKLCYEIEKLIF